MLKISDLHGGVNQRIQKPKVMKRSKTKVTSIIIAKASKSLTRFVRMLTEPTSKQVVHIPSYSPVLSVNGIVNKTVGQSLAAHLLFLRRSVWNCLDSISTP